MITTTTTTRARARDTHDRHQHQHTTPITAIAGDGGMWLKPARGKYVVVTDDFRVNGTCTVQRLVVNGPVDVNGVFSLEGYRVPCLRGACGVRVLVPGFLAPVQAPWQLPLLPASAYCRTQAHAKLKGCAGRGWH